MNVIEKIMAAHSGKESVEPGDMVDVSLDYVMANDVTTTLAIDVFKNELKETNVFDPKKLVVIMDHYTPSSSVAAADTHNKMREFCSEQGIENVHDGQGVCHQIMMEGYVCPGQVVIGADSHTCTYGALGALSTGMGSTDIAVGWADGKIWMKVPKAIKVTASGKWPKNVSAKDLILKFIGDITAQGATYQAVVFTGEAIETLSISQRATLCNMGIECGAKFAYIPPDEKTDEYMKQQGREEYIKYYDDEDAVYEKTFQYDVSSLVPHIAAPHFVDNVDNIAKFVGMKINQCFIGACTNGRYEDIEMAANVLKGKKIAKNVRLLITPASQEIYIKAANNGLLQALMEAGAMISNPGCSACFGGSVGIVGKDEVLLTTANRNFRGRVGSPDAKIYIASPAVVVASALAGAVAMPE